MTRPIPVAHVRPTHLILGELSQLSQRRAEVEAELAEAMRTPVPPPPCPAAAPAEYLTTAEAAALLGVSERHLKALRADGRGPVHARIGRSVRYHRQSIRDYAHGTPSCQTIEAPANAVRLPFDRDAVVPFAVEQAHNFR